MVQGPHGSRRRSGAGGGELTRPGGWARFPPRFLHAYSWTHTLSQFERSLPNTLNFRTILTVKNAAPCISPEVDEAKVFLDILVGLMHIHSLCRLLLSLLEEKGLTGRSMPDG